VTVPFAVYDGAAAPCPKIRSTTSCCIFLSSFSFSAFNKLIVKLLTVSFRQNTYQISVLKVALPINAPLNVD